MKRYIAIAGIMAAFAAPAGAQEAVAPGAAVPAPITMEGFRQAALMGDRFEIASSRLALERSRNPSVRSFAQRMVTDHSATTQALLGGGGPAVAGAPAGTATGAVTGAVVGGVLGGPVGAAVGAGVGGVAGATGDVATTGALPRGATGAGLDARKAEMLNRLAAARGAEFDRLYGRMQVMAHRDAIAMYSGYLQNGTDPTMRAYTQQVLPHLQQHLAMARRLPGAR